MPKTHLNPDALPQNPAFSQAVVVEGPVRTVYLGGQNAVTADGSVVGDTLVEQTRQALTNVAAVLAEAGGRLADVIRLTVAVVEGQPVADGFAAFREVWGDAGEPPALTVYIVSGLANPRFLVEIDAIAAL
jgi:enamine deaminase RidA (YjgF/YER057c/UK114 family)